MRCSGSMGCSRACCKFKCTARGTCACLFWLCFSVFVFVCFVSPSLSLSLSLSLSVSLSLSLFAFLCYVLSFRREGRTPFSLSRNSFLLLLFCFSFLFHFSASSSSWSSSAALGCVASTLSNEQAARQHRAGNVADRSPTVMNRTIRTVTRSDPPCQLRKLRRKVCYV